MNLKLLHNKWTTSTLNVGRAFVPPIVQLIIAKLVVDRIGMASWGNVVEVIIYMQISTIIAAWGNTEFTIRENSNYSRILDLIWNKLLITRLVVLLLMIILVFPFLPESAKIPFVCWSLIQFLIQSFDGLILIQKKIAKITLAEIIIAAIALVSVVVSNFMVFTNNVIWLLVFYNFFRLTPRVFIFFKTIKPSLFQIDPSLLKRSIPFMLLGLSGMLFSKIDLYVADFFLSKSDLGSYQLFITFYLQLQILAGFLIAPIAGILNRANTQLAAKISLRFTVLGLLITISASFVIHQILSHFYGINLNSNYFILGCLFSLATFMVSPIIYFLFGNHHEKYVLKMSMLGFSLNLVLSILGVMAFQMLGLILSTALSQLIVAIFYWTKLRSISTNKITQTTT